MVLMSSMAFAVTRSVSGTTVTYTAGSSFNIGIAKAYWVIEDTISGCTLNSVSRTSCGSNCEYSVISGKIRLVAYPPSEAGIAIGRTKSITLLGSGTGCTLLGNYAEAPGVAGSIASMGSSGISFEVTCNTDADGITGQPCDGCVHDIEFPTAVNDWKGAQTYISDSEFPTVVNKWKTQEGC